MKSLLFTPFRTIFLLMLWLPWISLQSAQHIKVPLGCSWGDTPEKLEELIHTGGLTLISTETVPSTQKKLITVQGVLGTALKQTIFIFQKEALLEIEYQYDNPHWDEKKYQEFFENFRRLFENKYGPGTALIKTTPSQKENGYIGTSLTGYEWTQSSCILDLFYYTATRGNQHYHLISAHYKMP